MHIQKAGFSVISFIYIQMNWNYLKKKISVQHGTCKHVDIIRLCIKTFVGFFQVNKKFSAFK